MKANHIPSKRRPPPLRRLSGVKAVLAGVAAGAALLILGSCAERAVPVAPPPSPPPRMMPPPPPVSQPAPANWRDSPLTPGEWRWSNANGYSSAEFGAATTGALLDLRCETGGHLRLQGIGLWNHHFATANVTISTSSLMRQTQAYMSDGDPPPLPTITLAFRDPILDAIAFSRGRFMVQVEGMPPLILPARPEVSRVIEDCRQH